jgi:hypothetical protein
MPAGETQHMNSVLEFPPRESFMTSMAVSDTNFSQIRFELSPGEYELVYCLCMERVLSLA